MSKTADHLEQLRDQPDDELLRALDRTRDELFRIQLGMHTNQVASPAELVKKRRDVAKILTILRNRKLGIETQAHGRGQARTSKSKKKGE